MAAADRPALFISVVDGTGTPMTDIDLSQVRFRIGGRLCASPRIELIDWPMKLQVLVDNGVAAAKSLPAITDALRAFIDELGEGIQTSLVAYAPEPRVLVQPTTNPQKLVAGLDLIAPSPRGARFVEAASQATERIASTKGDFFHTLMVITTDGPEETGGVAGKVSRMQKRLTEHPATAHVLMAALGDQPVVGKVAGAVQTQAGFMLTTATRGTFETVNGPAQLSAVMKEFGRKIARSNLLQTHQYRVTCDKPPSNSPTTALSIAIPLGGDFRVTEDGHLP
ncbi:MAG: VWA domain-containing protein [Vicinamibacterales bacterium]